MADDHAIFRDGLRKLLDGDEEIVIVGEAQNGNECVKLLAKLKPDILLLDLRMPEKDGLAVPEVGRPWRTHLELMPEGRKLVADAFRHARFDLHVASLEGTLGEAAGFERLLDGHPMIGDVGNELRVRLRLVPAAHDAESDLHLSLLQETGDDGVDRALARRERAATPRATPKPCR